MTAFKNIIKWSLNSYEPFIISAEMNSIKKQLLEYPEEIFYV